MKFLKWLSGLAMLSLAGLAVVTLAGFAGAWGWLFDLCAHFRPQYAIAAFLLLALLLALGRGWAALAALGVMAVNIAPIVSLYMAREIAVRPPTRAPALKVIAANIYQANGHRDRIVEYIRRENPDVVILTEVTESWVKPLEKLNKKYPFRWVRPGDVFAGIAVYSRYHPVESRVFDLAGAKTGSFLVTVELGDKANPDRISILGTHLKSPTSALYHEQRNRQLAELARIAREHPWPLLVVGDMNITQFSTYFGRTLRAGGLKPCTGQTLQPTWPAQFPPLFISIDHCLAAPTLRTWDFKVGPDVGSDHFPISVKAQPVRLFP